MLSIDEKQRETQLLEKFRINHTLTEAEAEELKTLIERDTNTDAAVKALLLFGIGVLLAILLNK